MEYAVRQQGYDGLKKPIIRVRIIKSQGNVTVGAKGSFIVRTWDVDSAKSAYYSGSPIVVKAEAGTLNLFDQRGNPLEQRLRKVTVIAAEQKWLWFNDKKFRGVLEFYPETGDAFYGVNALNVEDYLRGVLQPEIGTRTDDEYEAVKAQAVAARTYALVTKGKYADKGYDLINDISDQVYIGVEGEQGNTNKAVKQTRGEVLKYGGELIDAYYHSTCAGRTDNIEEVWEKQERPYLKGVTDNDFCRWSKFFEWNEVYPVAEFLDHIREYLRANGGDIAKVGSVLKGATIIDHTTGGRVKVIKIETNSGAINLFKDQIRWAFGRYEKPGIMPSTNFEISFERGEQNEIRQVQVIGYGYGHGVGMCQCGAIGMARFGWDYRKILTHYYTGVRIEKLY
jgi:stage II sporulation protein D